MKRYLINILFSVLPPTRAYAFKSFLLGLVGYKLGKNVRVVSSAKFFIRDLELDDDVFISHDVMIGGGTNSKVRIGKRTGIGPRSMIIAGTHEIGPSETRVGKGVSSNVTIGDGVWIGPNCTILANVNIGNGVIVGAGAVVTKDVPDNVLLGGVPGRVIREL